MFQIDLFWLWKWLLVLTGSAALLFLASVKRFWFDARDSKKERKRPEEAVKCSEILTYSGLQVQVSFICNTLL